MPRQGPDAKLCLARDQNEYVEDVMAFTHTTHDEVREQMKKGSNPLKEEWNAWERQGEMTSERIKAFYKQTKNYIYELAEWHLFVPAKRESDLRHQDSSIGGESHGRASANLAWVSAIATP